MTQSDGHAADYSDPRGEEVSRVGITFATIAGTLVLLRLSSRFIILRSPYWDDLLVTLSLSMSIVLATLASIQVKYGHGRPADDLPSEVVKQNLKLLYVFIICYYTGLLFVKSSIIIQYLRIFISKRMRITCWVVFAAVTAYSLSTIFGAAFTCYPVRFFWDPLASGPHTCLNQKALWFSNASLNILTDLVVLICPMPALKSLHLPKRQKIGIFLVFALGGVTVTMSILRLHALYVISESTDWTKDNVGAAMWSMIELNTGIMCACLPILKPLITRFFPKALGSTGRSTHGQPDSTMGHYSRQTNKYARTLQSHNSFYLAETTKPARRNDIRTSDEDTVNWSNENEIQVTTTVEVARQHNNDSEPALERSGSTNTSERSLVLPPVQSQRVVHYDTN
ncbi:hypothetical protein VTO42DRAFT_1297 [Malbranchea cinnamomea]